MENIKEQLLDAWMQITSSISNERLVRKIPYNEAYVCRLVLESMAKGEEIKASQLCERMHVLKSQMNKILNHMEQEGMIVRTASKTDKRAASILMTVKGQQIYYDEHESILKIMELVTDKIGTQDAKKLIELFGVIIESVEQLEDK